ncbi:hypothetical protein BDZ45DRAFT_170630 [Acephala macrosclerotiorum]|nr:hypothetical protein BDZ45DRAFT_170630 [Acephala macrosclerotiorum]
MLSGKLRSILLVLKSSHSNNGGDGTRREGFQLCFTLVKIRGTWRTNDTNGLIPTRIAPKVQRHQLGVLLTMRGIYFWSTLWSGGIAGRMSGSKRT